MKGERRICCFGETPLCKDTEESSHKISCVCDRKSVGIGEGPPVNFSLFANKYNFLLKLDIIFAVDLFDQTKLSLVQEGRNKISVTTITKLYDCSIKLLPNNLITSLPFCIIL